MEHINITKLENGMLRLTPETGYALYSSLSRQTYSEAEVKSTNGWKAVLSGTDPEPHERTLEDAKREKLAALHAFAEADKKFYIGNKAMWVGPDKRANLKNAVEALIARGISSVEYEGITIPADTALQMISAVEVYAAFHSMNEAKHRETINAKRSTERVDEYDVTTGYPEAPRFSM